jgi:hypothetical protein
MVTNIDGSKSKKYVYNTPHCKAIVAYGRQFDSFLCSANDKPNAFVGNYMEARHVIETLLYYWMPIFIIPQRLCICNGL